jgi:hypothetical protein
MSFGKVVRNAGSHRIIYALAFGVKTSKELKLVVGAINSISRFDGEYMSRLVAAGYVRKVFKGWSLTTQGTEKLNELGPVPGLNPQSKSFRDSVMKAPHYEPADYQAPARPGSEDFLELPSRIGNKLYYRDGTVKEITNGH